MKKNKFLPDYVSLDERVLASADVGFVMPPAYVETAPPPAPFVMPPAYIDPYSTTPPSKPPLIEPAVPQDPSLPPLKPYNGPPLEPSLPAIIVIPPVNLTPPSNPVWPSSYPTPRTTGPYDPNDPLQAGVAVPQPKPYYGTVLPDLPTIYDAKPGPMPQVPDLIPPVLPF